MTMFIIQALLLLAIAYILGCILGCVLHRLFAVDGEATATAATAASVAAGAGIAARSHASGEVTKTAAPAAAIDPGRSEAEAKANEARARARAEADANARAEAEQARLKAEANARAKVEAEAKMKAEAAAKAAARAKAEKAQDASPAATLVAEPAAKTSAPVKAKTTASKASTKTTSDTAKGKSAASSKDDLKMIRGIGPQNEARLNAVDVHTFAQIASWNAAKQEEMGQRLAFPGRIEREDWVGQAKILAAGKSTEFSERVAKGEVESSIGRVTKAELGTAPKSLAEPRKSGADDLGIINGIGKSIHKKLNALGIYHFDQIAKWTEANQDWIGFEIGHPGRVQREEWVSQAVELSKK